MSHWLVVEFESGWPMTLRCPATTWARFTKYGAPTAIQRRPSALHLGWQLYPGVDNPEVTIRHEWFNDKRAITKVYIRED